MSDTHEKKKTPRRKPLSKMAKKMKEISELLVDADFKISSKDTMLMLYGTIEEVPDDFNVMVVFKEDSEVLRIEIQSPFWVKTEERYITLEAINSFVTTGAVGSIFIEEETNRITWGYDVMWQLAGHLSALELKQQVIRSIELGVKILHALLDTLEKVNSASESDVEEILIPVAFMRRPDEGGEG